MIPIHGASNFAIYSNPTQPQAAYSGEMATGSVMSRRGESFSRDMPLIPATGGDSGGESGGFPFVHASSTSAEESR